MPASNLRALRRRVASNKLQAFRRARYAEHADVGERLQEWFLSDPARHPRDDRYASLEDWVQGYDGRRRDRWREDCPCCRQVYCFRFGLSRAGDPLPFELAALRLIETPWPGRDTEPWRTSTPRRFDGRSGTALPSVPNDSAALSAADLRVIGWYERVYADGPEPLLAALASEPCELDAFGELRRRIASSAASGQVDAHFEAERAALLALMTYPLWRRSLAEWRGGSGVDLLRHLLGPPIDTPALYAAVMAFGYGGPRVCREGERWVMDPREIAVDPLLWIVAQAHGASVRRIARQFGVTLSTALIGAVNEQRVPNEPGESEWPYRMQELLTRAAVRAAGGSDVEMRRVVPLSYSVERSGPEDTAFWRSTVQWLTRWRDELEDDQALLAMRWGVHRRSEDPAFSFAGRSVRAVIRRAEGYAAEIWRRNEQRRLEIERAQRGEQVTAPLAWAAQGWNLEWQDDAGIAWRMQELTDAHLLVEEGAALQHCVGAYAQYCADGQSAIFQLQRAGIRRVTIEVRLSGRRVVQARGRFNSRPGSDAHEAIAHWAQQFAIIGENQD